MRNGCMPEVRCLLHGRIDGTRNLEKQARLDMDVFPFMYGYFLQVAKATKGDVTLENSSSIWDPLISGYVVYPQTLVGKVSHQPETKWDR